jgi:hypothetical protein
MINIRRVCAVAVALAAVTGSFVAPTASAALVPGDSCDPATDHDPAGRLECSGLHLRWLTKGVGDGVPGRQCGQLGAVTYAKGEQLAKCVQTPSGLRWTLWASD